MAGNPRIRRLALVPHASADGELRRYRLARLDEIALATPPDPSLAEPRGVPLELRAEAAKPPDGPARPA